MRPLVKLLSHTNDIKKVLSYAASKCRQTKPRDGVEYDRMITSIVKKDEGSVIEHATINFEILGISTVAMAQITRHRIASYTIESQRYVKRDGELSLPFLDDEKYKDSEAMYLFKTATDLCYNTYNTLIDKFGWRKDHARYLLPMCDSRDMVASFNLRSLRNFLEQRLAKKAQHEMRIIAEQMLIIAMNIPNCAPIFRDLWKAHDEKEDWITL